MSLTNTDPPNDGPPPNHKEHFTVSVTIGIIFIVVLCGVFGVVYLIDDILPTPLNIEDENDYPESFIAERAQQHLKKLTSIGPRITGSYESEVLAVELLKSEIVKIQNQAHPNQKNEFDVQVVSGSFSEDGSYNINAYGNVQNVIVKLHSRNGTKDSLLVNVHFDTVPISQGGSDDGINCAAVLEILRKLSQLPEGPLHNIIFLFNGAEEAPILASHGFITQHAWAEHVQVFINLEASGAGGKIILFQVGPKYPWLLKYYSGVPHPYAQTIGEEIFQARIIPSDTDFKIFRDYGKAIGFDFAFIRDGYRYHTSYDRFENIPEGSYQHVGDNILYLIKAVANADELGMWKEPSSRVFYDYMGLFLISYSETVATILNCITAALSVLVAIKSFYNFRLGKSPLYIIITLTGLLLGWIISAAVVTVIAVIIDALNFSMSWYANQWILFGLYITPVVVCSCGVIVLFNYLVLKNQEKITISMHTQVLAHLTRLLWTLPLLIGTFVGIRGVYLIFIPVLFESLSFTIIHIFKLHYSEGKWLFIYLAGTIIPNVFLMQLSLTLIDILIPVTGRIGPSTNPEIMIGLLTFICTILITSVYMPLITFVPNSKILLTILSAICLIFLLMVFTPIGFPYSRDPASPRPQRIWTYHSSRTFRDENNNIYKKDSGFFIYDLDRNSPNSVKGYVNDLNNLTSVTEDCRRSLYCGLPLGRHGSSNSDDITWMSAEEPQFHTPISLKLNSKTITKRIRTYEFTAIGPERMEIYISPKRNVNLIGTSLTTKLSKPVKWNGRPLYTIIYTWGRQPTPLTFSLQFATPENWDKPTFEIALVGRYLNDKINEKTPHFKQYLSEFPDWTDVVAWLSNYESWVY